MLKTEPVSIFVLVIIIFLAMVVSNAAPPKEHNPQNSKPHTINIVETSGNWEMLWRWPDIYIIGPPVTTDDTLCYVADHQESSRSSGFDSFLACLDIHSGIEKWAANWDHTPHIASDLSQVYATVGNRKFVAYNAANGEEVWQQSIKARSISDIVAYDGFVKAEVVVGGELNVYHVFDATTGTHQDSNDVPSMSYYSFASDGQRRFLQPSHNTIKSYWEAYFDRQIMFKPILNDGLVFVRTNHVVGTAHALDGGTGRIIWEKEDVVSNVAVGNSTAYYITIDGEVMAVDAQTGEIMGRLKFNAEELVDINTSDNTPYYVEAVDDMVFVYFGDTWQLFAFRFSQE